jgi:hypothetical protein
MQGDSFLVQSLKSKDEAVDVPADWIWVKNNKNRYLMGLEEKGRYEHTLAGGCIKSCFHALKTSVVNVEESECMTSCMAKGIETRACFDYLKAKKDYK